MTRRAVAGVATSPGARAGTGMLAPSAHPAALPGSSEKPLTRGGFGALRRPGKPGAEAVEIRGLRGGGRCSTRTRDGSPPAARYQRVDEDAQAPSTRFFLDAPRHAAARRDAFGPCREGAIRPCLAPPRLRQSAAGCRPVSRHGSHETRAIHVALRGGFARRAARAAGAMRPLPTRRSARAGRLARRPGWCRPNPCR